MVRTLIVRWSMARLIISNELGAKLAPVEITFDALVWARSSWAKSQALGRLVKAEMPLAGSKRGRGRLVTDTSA